MYASINGIWYENSDKYSVSTSRHQSQLRPSNVSKEVNTEELISMINEEVKESD